MSKLFNPIETGYDPKNRPVHICINEDGSCYVYKPQSGYKSGNFPADSENLKAIFNRQIHDGQTFASYLPGEKEGEAPADKDNAGNDSGKTAPAKVADVVAKIKAAVTADEVTAIVGTDTRKAVLAAAGKKIKALA